MRIVAVTVGILIACLAATTLAADEPTSGGAATESASLETKVKQRMKEFDATWATHDAKAIAAHYTTDGDIVTADGNTLSGREGIEQALTDAFNGQLKDSTLTTTVTRVRQLTPDVVLVDADAQMKPAEGDPQTMHLVSVLVKKDGKWLTATTRAIIYKQ